MIVVKLENIVNSTDVLRKLAEKTLKGKTAYKVARLLRELDKELTLFNETRAELIRNYGVKDENGELVVNEKGDYTIAPEHVNDFYKDITETLNNEIEISANKITLEEIESLEFTANEIMMLEPFIEE